MSRSNLLIKEPPLQVLPSLAVAIGLNEAIVLQQIHYWLENPKAGVERDGFKWVFNTYDEWHENFPFWSVSTIQRIFSSLEEQRLIISEQLDKKKHDMKKFYRIDYAVLCTMGDVNLTRSTTPNRHDDNGTTETTAENKEGVQKIVTSANKTVDAILETERKSIGKEWTKLPEIYHNYGKAFCNSTGLSYHKKYFNDWAATFDEWALDGYQSSDVALAVTSCREKGLDISRPGSITWKLRAMVAQKQPESTPAVFADPLEGQYVPNPNPLPRRTTA